MAFRKIPPTTAAEVLASMGGNVSIVDEVSKERLKRSKAEKEAERLKRKVVRHPEFLRESFERAIAQAGETPAEALVKLAYEQDANGDYVLPPKERKDILKMLLPYTLPAYKAKDDKRTEDGGIKVVIQNFHKPPEKAPDK